MSLRKAFEALGVALAFAACGAVSGLTVFPAWYIVAIPFGALSTWIHLRRLSGAWVIVLYAFVWHLAFTCTGYAYLGFKSGYAPMMFGGFLGGIGVAISLRLGQHRRVRFRHTLGAAALGAFTAIPLGSWANSYPPDAKGAPHGYMSLALGFATWQASLGTYLHFVKPKEPNSQAFSDAEWEALIAKPD